MLEILHITTAIILYYPCDKKRSREHRMLTELPVEIQVTLLKLCPDTELKHTSSYFYSLYNDLFYDKLVRTFGDDVLQIIAKVYPWLRIYVKSLDTFRETSRKVIANRLALADIDADYRQASVEQILLSQFVKDSWKYVYSLFKNRRLFAEYSDYKIDEPTNYIFNHYVEVNRSYLLSYSKTVWLAPGKYNLNIGLVVKHGNGLGTTKFEVKYTSNEGKEIVQTFYPPTNINEILPKKQFCFLKVGEFSIPSNKLLLPQEGPISHDRLYKTELTMEEIGLYLKSGFSIFFIDISQPSLLFNDFDLLFYSCPETDYRFYINLPLKNFYKALEIVQCGDPKLNTNTSYGEGDPQSIENEYDYEYDFTSLNTSMVGDDARLMAYADHFFNNTLNQRNFKFNTMYQRTQFVNRFGEFSPDNNNNTGNSSCTYDIAGLKWRIPILGEL